MVESSPFARKVVDRKTHLYHQCHLHHHLHFLVGLLPVVDEGEVWLVFEGNGEDVEVDIEVVEHDEAVVWVVDDSLAFVGVVPRE